jgi:serine/threonine protein phosphatase PrpC
MEDAHIANTKLANGISVFGVFDGHGGKSNITESSIIVRSRSSHFCKETLRQVSNRLRKLQIENVQGGS